MDLTVAEAALVAAELHLLPTSPFRFQPAPRQAGFLALGSSLMVLGVLALASTTYSTYSTTSTAQCIPPTSNPCPAYAQAGVVYAPVFSPVETLLLAIGGLLPLAAVLDFRWPARLTAAIASVATAVSAAMIPFVWIRLFPSHGESQSGAFFWIGTAGTWPNDGSAWLTAAFAGLTVAGAAVVLRAMRRGESPRSD